MLFFQMLMCELVAAMKQFSGRTHSFKFVIHVSDDQHPSSVELSLISHRLAARDDGCWSSETCIANLKLRVSA